MLCKCTECTWPAEITGADCTWKTSGWKTFQKQVSDTAWLSLSGSVVESLMRAASELEKDWKVFWKRIKRGLLKAMFWFVFSMENVTCFDRQFKGSSHANHRCDLYGSFHHHKADTLQGTDWEFVFTQVTWEEIKIMFPQQHKLITLNRLFSKAFPEDPCLIRKESCA